MALSIVFMGTPAFSVPTLRALHRAGHRIAAVYTQPPRPAGRRGLSLVPSPVAAAAEDLGIEIRNPTTLKAPEEQASFAALSPDVAVVVAYGLLLPPAILAAPRHGALNAHASLLPRWRGAAPIQRAVEAGDRETGMMVMRMEQGLDTGPVAVTSKIAIGAGETAGELHDRLAVLSARCMIQALDELEAGTLTFEDQGAIARRTGREPVYARKIDKGETAVDFEAPAAAVAAKINAFSPSPGAWTAISASGREERLRLLRAVAVAEDGTGEPGTIIDEGLLVACATGAVRLLEVQRAGGRPAAAEDFLRGTPLPVGLRLGGG